MKSALLILIGLFALPMVAQQTMSLDECYALVSKNYPLAKQRQLLEQQNTLDQKAIATGNLPQLDLSAKATYQSDVIEFPVPNAGIEPLKKDQYRATFSINQPIYNGGLTKATSQVKSAKLKMEQQQVDVSLYQLKNRVNLLYFSILLLQEQHNLLTLKQNQLQAKLKEVKSGIRYGAVLPASDKVLEVELLKIEQQFTEIGNNRFAIITSLSRLIGQSIRATATFQKPNIDIPMDSELKRPELALFQYKKEEIQNSQYLISRENQPKLSGFATGGYGSPGLNMLDDSFRPFYIVGLEMKWNVFDWNANKSKRESMDIQKDVVDNESEVFKLNTDIELQQKRQDIHKFSELINTDSEIIGLRKEVLSAADSQLRNGVITASAYMTELTNLYEAENTYAAHGIQLQLAKANYMIAQGQ